MSSFATEVKNFCENHTLLCVATLGFAIPIYCMGRLFGCITKPTGTTKKVNDVASPLPTPPKASIQQLPPASKAPNVTPTPQVNIPVIDELKAQNKETFKNNLEDIAKKIDAHQKEWEASQKRDRNSRIEEVIKKHENNDAFKDKGDTLLKLAEMQADSDLRAVELKHEAFITTVNALLSTACGTLFLTKEEKDELLQPFLEKYSQYIK